MHNPTKGSLFGSLVRRYRDAARLTQEQLAERAGSACRPSVSWNAGCARPRIVRRSSCWPTRWVWWARTVPPS